MRRGLLISSGGSWGAYGGGTLARLNKDYNIVIGVSTGALMSPLVALKKWELLKEAYTSMKSNNFFDTFWYKQKPISRKGKIRKLPIIISLILGQRTIGTSKALKKMIDKYFTESCFNELQSEGKEILVGTQNFAEIPSKIHYFSSSIEVYDDFKDWLWCSANFPFFTSLIKKGWRDENGHFHIGEWSDGGLTDFIGIEQLLGRGYDEIDIILHRKHNTIKYEGKIINTLLDNITAGFEAMRHDIEFESISKAILKLNEEGTNVNIYWLPRTLDIDSLVFNEALMIKWWDEGYNTALDDNRIEKFPALKKKNNIVL